jgi:hypothetical protein
MLRNISRQLGVAMFVALAQVAWAQTAGAVIEKHLAALGGRAALGKLTSAIQTVSVVASQVEHNTQIDQTLFSKPESGTAK